MSEGSKKGAPSNVNKLISLFEQLDDDHPVDKTDGRIKRSSSFTEKYLSQFTDHSPKYRQRQTPGSQSSIYLRTSLVDADDFPSSQARKHSLKSDERISLQKIEPSIREDVGQNEKEIEPVNCQQRHQQSVSSVQINIRKDANIHERDGLQLVQIEKVSITEPKIKQVEKIADVLNDPKKLDKVPITNKQVPSGNPIDDAPQPKPVKSDPTVIPYEFFNPSIDAKALQKALEEGSSKRYILVEILSARTYSQRCQISDYFYELFGKSLTTRMKDELTGNFEKVMVALLAKKCDFYAKKLCKSMKGIGTDENCLIEVLCSQESNTIEGIKKSYQKLYKCSLLDTVCGDTSGRFEDILRGILITKRQDPVDVSVQDVTNQLCKLADSCTEKKKESISKILIDYPRPFLHSVFSNYTQSNGKNFLHVIEKEFDGDCRNALLTICKSALNIHDYYAVRMNSSFSGIGVIEDTLIEMAITRSEVDLMSIVNCYYEKYKSSVYEQIKSKTSGNFQLLMLALFGDHSVNEHYRLMDEAYDHKETNDISKEETCHDSENKQDEKNKKNEKDEPNHIQPNETHLVIESSEHQNSTKPKKNQEIYQSEECTHTIENDKLHYMNQADQPILVYSDSVIVEETPNNTQSLKSLPLEEDAEVLFISEEDRSRHSGQRTHEEVLDEHDMSTSQLDSSNVITSDLPNQPYKIEKIVPTEQEECSDVQATVNTLPSETAVQFHDYDNKEKVNDMKLASECDVSLPSHITGLECFPTIVPAHKFDAVEDAAILRQYFACHKLDDSLDSQDTEEYPEILIDVFMMRCSSQRIQIKAEFKKRTEDLKELILSDSCGYFQGILLALLDSPLTYITKELHNALTSFTVIEKDVMEIICSSNQIELRRIQIEYLQLFNEPLPTVVAKTLTGPLRCLVLELLKENDENKDVSSQYAYIAGLYRNSNLSYDSIFEVMTSNNFEVLFGFFYLFETLLGSQFGDIITEVCKGVNRGALLIIYKSIMNRHAYYAEVLHHALTNHGAKEATLTRVIVGRCEIDLQSVKSEYVNNFDNELEEIIKTNTTGLFKHALLALLIGNKSSRPFQKEGSMIIYDDVSQNCEFLTPDLHDCQQEAMEVDIKAINESKDAELLCDNNATLVSQEETLNEGIEQDTVDINEVKDVQRTVKHNDVITVQSKDNYDVINSQDENIPNIVPLQNIIEEQVEITDKDACENVKNIDEQYSTDENTIQGNTNNVELQSNDCDIQLIVSKSNVTYYSKFPWEEQPSPTIHEVKAFSPETEAKTLLQELEDGSISSVLTTITKVNTNQRQILLKCVQENYAKDIITKLTPHLTDKCTNFIKYLSLSRCEILAHELNKALSGNDRNIGTAVELLITADQNYLENVSNSYEKLFNVCLIDDIMANTSGTCQGIVVNLLTTQRIRHPVDSPSRLAKQFADMGNSECAILSDYRTVANEDLLVKSMITFSYRFLFDIFYAYAYLSKFNFISVIKELTDGDVQIALTEIYDWIYKRDYFSSKMQHEARDQILTRILTTRCEIDLERIKKDFESSSGHSLLEYCWDITDAYYKMVVFSVINGNKDYRFETSQQCNNQEDQIEELQGNNVPSKSAIEDEGMHQEIVECGITDGSSKISCNISPSDDQLHDKSAKNVQFQNDENVPLYLNTKLQVSYASNTEVPYDATEDATAMKKALRGIVIDDKTIIDILSKRSASQRMQICIKYEYLCGKALVHKLKAKLRGDYENLATGLITPIHAYLAKEINNTVKGIGTDENSLTEIICLQNEDCLQLISAAYKNLYDCTLQKAVADDLSGGAKQLLDLILSTKRCDGDKNPYQLAEHFCQTDVTLDQLIQVMGNYTHIFLFKFFTSYDHISGYNFLDLIKKLARGDAKIALITLYECITSRHAFLAGRLHSSMKGHLTKETTISRIIISRREIDLKEIKAKYEEIYQQPLIKDIKSLTHGSYRKLLLALL